MTSWAEIEGQYVELLLARNLMQLVPVPPPSSLFAGGGLNTEGLTEVLLSDPPGTADFPGDNG